MNIIARILLTGEGLPEFESQWNRDMPHRKMFFGAIALNVESPEYQRLLDTTAPYISAGRIRFSGGKPHLTAEYTTKELYGFELIELRTNSLLPISRKAYEDAFSENVICSKCHATILRQLSPISVEDIPSGSDIFEALVDEPDPKRYLGTLASERFRQVLADIIPPGELEFRPVTSGPGPLHQLVITGRIGPVTPPTVLVSGNPCEVCGQRVDVNLTDNIEDGGEVDARRAELCFQRGSYGGQSIARTTELFGYQRWQCDGLLRPILVSQRAFRALVGSGLRGLLYFPAHLIDGCGRE